jgi:hypothetical protein
METAARFCKRCGTAFGDDSARFCKKCGAARSAPVVAPRLVAPAPAAAALGRASGIVSRAAGSPAAALPWQTITAGEPIDAAVFLRGAAPAATRALSRSLRRPGLILAFTIAMSVAVALLTGGADALVSALPQLLAGAAATGLSLVTGARAGTLRAVTGVVSVGAAVVAVIALGLALARGTGAGDSLVSLLPLAVSFAASALAALKTALVALGRP